MPDRPTINPDAFTHKLQVLAEDIDEMGHVNNVVYVRWVQDVAIAHWLKVSTVAIRTKYSWVLLRHEIDYRNPAFLDDEIVGQTWVGKHEGPKFERFVTLHNVKSGAVLAESKTVWCLLDARSMRPKRIDVDIVAAFGGAHTGRALEARLSSSETPAPGSSS